MNENEIAADTASTCWLCDPESGELCHVHDKVDAPPLAWVRHEHGDDGGTGSDR